VLAIVATVFRIAHGTRRSGISFLLSILAHGGRRSAAYSMKKSAGAAMIFVVDKKASFVGQIRCGYLAWER
jgi:hypothetical protein